MGTWCITITSRVYEIRTTNTKCINIITCRFLTSVSQSKILQVINYQHHFIHHHHHHHHWLVQSLIGHAYADHICVNSIALPLVEVSRFSIDPKESGIEPIDFLQYYYYAGLIFIGMKQYPKALESFQMVLTIPTMTLSAVQVEAFKKYVLVCLLVHGEVRIKFIHQRNAVT